MSADLDTRILNLHDKNITPYDIGRRVGLTSHEVRERLSAHGISVRLPFGLYESRLWEDNSEDRLRGAIIAQDEAFKAAVRAAHFPRIMSIAPPETQPAPKPATAATEAHVPPFRGGVKEITPIAAMNLRGGEKLPRDVIDVADKPKKDFAPYLTVSSRIIGEVVSKHQVSILELRSPRKEKRLVLARQEACYRLKNETSLSLPQIGRLLGGRDHTTVLHSVRRVEAMIAEARKESAA